MIHRRIRPVFPSSMLAAVLIVATWAFPGCSSPPPPTASQPWGGIFEDVGRDGMKHLRIPPYSGACLVRLSPAALANLPARRTLGDVGRHLESALKGAGYFNLEFYQVDGGFALVTPLELIEENGTPFKDQARWKSNGSITSIKEWLQALAAGNYQTCRVISFVVTNQTVPRNNVYLPIADLQPWRQGGAILLAKNTADNEYMPDYEIYALVYVFKIEEKIGPSGEVERKGYQVKLIVSPETHLANAGIAAKL